MAVRGEWTTAGQQSCMTANGKPRLQRRSAPWPRPDTRTAPAIRAKRRTTPFIRQSVRVRAKPFALNREPSQSETTALFRFGLGLGPDQRLSPAGPFPRGPDYGCGRGNLYSEAESGPGLSWIEGQEAIRLIAQKGGLNEEYIEEDLISIALENVPVQKARATPAVKCIEKFLNEQNVLLSPAGPFPSCPDYGCGRGNLYSEAGSDPGLSWIGLRRQRSNARNHPGRAVPTEPA